MLSATCDFAIGAYQRYLSPYKGFACAHRVHTNRCSCSAFARRAIRKYGAFKAFTLLLLRFETCRASAAVLQSAESGESGEDSVINEPCPLWGSPEGRQCLSNAAVSACPCWPGWPFSRI
ncbi:membrane protein insertion efficiency factor YidD [Paucibacter sediminis]|uniref:Membrane protein insertion efficiency factor YidD n=1 Tax=Paucibacter sediminis TaxID=3019553 RepID=A0AA95NK70_9BURK|nr:membrane protein insertion efficiency factor YidD [Paucibacter sp. S2-9]WIT14279.1 membrane protein insertion efficiency factor YidD [Paucibacter sp. S2-9]